MCPAQVPQRSGAGEARTCGPSVSIQALYHWATALHFTGFIFSWDFMIITNTCVDKFDINFIGWQEQQLGEIDNLICW